MSVRAKAGLTEVLIPGLSHRGLNGRYFSTSVVCWPPARVTAAGEAHETITASALRGPFAAKRCGVRASK